jgi:NAD(P)-dependent dehydrogenase (short-subunit alcohol dehydrogenase family)
MSQLPSPASIFDLTGKSALVTGATGAFGEQAALALAGAGAHVTIAGGNEEKLRLVESRIVVAGGRTTIVNRRPTSEQDVNEILMHACADNRGIDIVVSGTGTNLVSPIHEQRVEDWDAVMDVNVRQSWLLCRAAGRVMLEQRRGGKVILMSSARSTLGMANYSAYCPSKAAIDLLARSLACEWGPHGIQVNAIAPTVFRSELTGWMFADEGNGPTVRANVLKRIPLGRLGEPTDFHGVIQLLASKGSDFMTGAIVHVDGGYTAG